MTSLLLRLAHFQWEIAKVDHFPFQYWKALLLGLALRFRTGSPNMSSVHAGLSGSFTLAEVFFGNLVVSESFMSWSFFLATGSILTYQRTATHSAIAAEWSADRKVRIASKSFSAVVDIQIEFHNLFQIDRLTSSP